MDKQHHRLSFSLVVKREVYIQPVALGRPISFIFHHTNIFGRVAIKRLIQAPPALLIVSARNTIALAVVGVYLFIAEVEFDRVLCNLCENGVHDFFRRSHSMIVTDLNRSKSYS